MVVRVEWMICADGVYEEADVDGVESGCVGWWGWAAEMAQKGQLAAAEEDIMRN